MPQSNDLNNPIASANPAPAPASPVDATWTRADKTAVGTAASMASQVWYTLAGGIITELYYPRVDTPQVRDVQFLVTDGTFFHDPKHDYNSSCEPIDKNNSGALGFVLINRAKDQNYTITHEIIAEMDAPVVLIRTTLTGDPALLARLKVYVLVAPHIEGAGDGNSAYVAQTAIGSVLAAHRPGTNSWVAVGADCGLGLTNCGFVGNTDGWTDIIGHRRLPQWQYDSAENGNVAMLGEIDRQSANQFVVAIAFSEGDDSTPMGSLVALNEALALPFEAQGQDYGHLDAFKTAWEAVNLKFAPAANATGDNAQLFRFSRNVLMAHEDKKFSGALVASLSIPWGEAQNDQGGGYHFVWPRDMCQSASALLATGEADLPLRALHFLAATQRTDGSWNQNFYITGKYHWTGIQLDEFSFPVILAYRLKQHGALQLYDPRPMVMAAANAMVSYGPISSEERWEENAGFSPSTLAANIAALVCAANFSAEKVEDAVTTQFLLDYADFLESKLEDWLVTTNGPLPNGPRYYIRILPPGQPEDPNTANKTFYIKNRGYGFPPYAPNEIVDGGFLELVRYGIRSANDATIQATVRVVDAVIKKDGLPAGPCWYRYNHDGYGQNTDGSPFLSTGLGRPWPLLAGERAHYELAAGNNVSAYVRSLETMAAPVSLLPEQIWDAAPQDYGDFNFVLGGPTGSSRPLAWAHAEYIKLVRSVSDGAVFDRIDVVANRYLNAHAPSNLEVWNWNRPVSAIRRGKTLRIITNVPARVHWSDNVAVDGTWIEVHDTSTTATSLRQVYYADLPTNAAPGSRLMFTFYWPLTNVWENQTYTVQLL